MKFTDSPKYKDNIILKLTFEFAIDIVRYSEKLDENQKYVIAKQILRSGTSIGANVKEAQNSESNRDFIHKFKISAKETDELHFWLELCKSSEFYPTPNEELFKKLQSINLIISKIISSSKKG